MRLYYSTCISGLERAAAKAAASTAKGYSQKQLLNGAVIYQAMNPARAEVFQNTYLLLGRYDRCRDLNDAIRRALNDRQAFSAADDAIRRKGFSSYRVMFSDGNRLQTVESSVRAAFERHIRAARVDRVTPETELLVLRRTEGFAFFLLRMVKREGEKPLKGELAPGVAQCMVLLARPSKEGVFFDPFAGHGALGAARLKAGPAYLLRLCDTDENLVRQMRARFHGQAVEVEKTDALRITEKCKKGFATELVTDPPWGVYEPLPMPVDVFCRAILDQFAHALAAHGQLVVLFGDRESFDKALRAHPAFDPRDRFDVLINGKKAAIFQAVRRPFTEGE